MPDGASQTRIARVGLARAARKRSRRKHRKIAHRQAGTQIGTLGGGNHFIEICLDETDAVWVMLHSGSRGIGNAIGTLLHRAGARAAGAARAGLHLPDKDLAFFMEGAPQFDDYVEAVAGRRTTRATTARR